MDGQEPITEEAIIEKALTEATIAEMQKHLQEIMSGNYSKVPTHRSHRRPLQEVNTSTGTFGRPRITIERLIPDVKLPEHAGHNPHDNIGLDFYAGEDVVWEPLIEGSLGRETLAWVAKVRSGVRLDLPYGYHIQLASRSGLAVKNNVYAFPGVLDSSYTGEVLIQLLCLQAEPPKLEKNSKIAQGIVIRSWDCIIQEGVVSKETERGEKGFGSTG